MNESEPFSVSAVQKKRDQSGSPAQPGPAIVPTTGPRPARPTEAPTAEPEKSGGLPFDPARLVMALWRGWYWLPLVGLLLAVPLGLLGYFKFQTGYSVEIQLIRREVTTTIRATDLGDAFKPRQVSVETVVSLMQSPKLLDSVANEAHPPTTGAALLGGLTIKPEKDTDLIGVTLKTKSNPAATADLINLYSKQVIALTGQMQSDEAAELDAFLRDQIAKTDLELESVNKELLDFRRDNEFYGEDRELESYLRQLSDAEVQLQRVKTDDQTAEFRITSLERELGRQNPVAQQLTQARNDLATLRMNYTDNNPLVQDALDKVANLEKQVLAQAKSSTTNQSATNQPEEYQLSDNNTVGNDLYMQLISLRDQRSGYTKQIAQLETFSTSVQDKLKLIPEKSQHYARIVAHQQSMQATHDLLVGRQREAQVYEDNPPGFYRVFAPATEDTVEKISRWKKIILVVIGAFIFGFGAALVGVCGIELMNLRVVSASDLRRSTGVPVAVRVPDLGKLDETELGQWRFRTWSQLLRQLKLQNDQHVIMAFASAQPGEGKSFFIRHLRDAAHDRRLPVVTVTNSPTTGANLKSISLAEALATPDLVTRHLRDQPSIPVELVYDATWHWSLENRAAWQRAMEVWSALPVLSLLVELPAMTGLDAVLAAELMPVLIWITASGGLQQRELATTLQLIEAGEIPLSAAVLNREPAMLAKLSFLGKFGLFLVLASTLFGTNAHAYTTSTNALAGAVVTNGPDVNLRLREITRRSTLAEAIVTNGPAVGELSFSSETPQLADWQQHLAIGPGDSFNFYIYGKQGTIRNDVTVTPDGRLSYLEAQSVPVSGLTVDEMRAKLDGLLAVYYHNPHTVAMPVTWRSKKYFILGAVMDRGAYILDRPLTIIEAVARARGIATGLYEHNTVELADMPRAFLVRDGERMPVDFDRLFNKGDLSQNILLAPNDYIYFPSGTVNEVYLLGDVGSPGPLGLTAETTMIGVLTVRGGFTPTAYRQHVLVVRGSLQHPQTFVVDVAAILKGKQKDFQLLPKDIIYVADKPWQRAEELTQMALSSFTQTMTATWAGEYIGPIITHQILPAP